MNEQIRDLLDLGIEESKRKAEGRRKRAIREAQDLGTEPNLVETISPWKKGLLNDCPYLFRVAGEMMIGPTAKDPNRGYGSSVHEGFAVLAKGGDYSAAVRAFEQDWKRRSREMSFEGKRYNADDLYAMGPKALAALAAELDNSDEIYTEGVEHWFDWTPIINPDTGEQIAGFVLAGRCDLPRKRKGQPASIEDLKNLASHTPEAERSARAGIDEQLVIYAVMAENDSLLSPLEIRHTGRLETNKAKRSITVARFPLHEVTEDDKRALFWSVRDAVMRILFYRDAEENGAPLEYAWPRNHGSCFGKFGVCDLAPICHPHLFPETDYAKEFGIKTFD